MQVFELHWRCGRGIVGLLDSTSTCRQSACSGCDYVLECLPGSRVIMLLYHHVTHACRAVGGRV